MKRLLKILTICVLVLTAAISFVACGENGGGASSKKGLIYKKGTNDAYYTLYKYVDEGNGVTSLDLSALDITIGRIKSGAFDGNDTLKEIIVADTGDAENPLTIEEGAFKGMKKLEKITLPFVGATAKADAYVSETAPSDKSVGFQRTIGYIFGTDSDDELAEVSLNYSESGSNTVYIPSTLTEITVKVAGEYKIPMYAFCGLTQVTSVNLEGTITAIGDSAFKDMKQLNKITVPATVTVIYNSAFTGCDSLKDYNGETGKGFKIADGSALVKIGDYAFKGTKIKTFALPANTEIIGESCFAESGIESFTFSANIKTVEAYAFYGCKSLTEVGIPALAGEATLGVSCFQGCENLDATGLKAAFSYNENQNVFKDTKA